jgi:hypothetical protein
MQAASLLISQFVTLFLQSTPPQDSASNIHIAVELTAAFRRLA